MKIYVIGPISGYEKYNEPAFRVAKTELEYFGHTALIPHDIPPSHEGDCPDIPDYAQHDKGHKSACFIRSDMVEMLTCDAVYILPGWENSVGSRNELQQAAITGMQIFFEYNAVKTGVPNVRSS